MYKRAEVIEFDTSKWEASKDRGFYKGYMKIKDSETEEIIESNQVIWEDMHKPIMRIKWSGTKILYEIRGEGDFRTISFRLNA